MCVSAGDEPVFAECGGGFAGVIVQQSDGVVCIWGAVVAAIANEEPSPCGDGFVGE